MSVMTFFVVLAILSCGCGVGVGFAIGVNVGLWHERRRAAIEPPRPILFNYHEHFGDGTIFDDEESDGESDDDSAPWMRN